MHLKLAFLILVLSVSNFSYSSPENLNKKAPKIKLINWKAEACDNTFDPYRLKNRITEIETKNDVTSITVNFSDNCCAEFKPKIEFKDNKLTLLPYEKYTGGYCDCNCCFSIRFEISGLQGNQYEIYFRDKKVELSSDHYEAVEPSFTMYKSKKINQINKYGFPEGLWISFYENGSEKEIKQYQANCIYHECQLEWSKGFYESGKLSYYERNDTSESWFPDGELKSQVIV